jgi:hypothetical protein
MRILAAILFFVCSAANAQFVTGQILTAAQLNAAFANVLSMSGGTLTGPLTVQGNTTVANLTVNGAFTVPGGFSPGSLSPQAANSLLGNASGATAAPSVIAVPSCSASGNALKWTSASGFTCGTGNALTANPLSQFAATTSAQLAGIVSDESGSGSLLFGTSPTIATPAITGGTISGTPVSGSTGSFTTLAASSTVSGAGFTTLLSPYLTSATAASTYATIAQATTALAATGGSISGVSVAATTLSASGNDVLTYTNTSGQSIATGTPATVTGWTKTFDRLNTNFAPSTGIFTAPATGFYAVSTCILYAANAGAANTSAEVLIVANSVVVARGANFRYSTSSVGPQVCATADVSLTSGQTIFINAFQTSGGAVLLQTSTNYSFLSIHRIP